MFIKIYSLGENGEQKKTATKSAVNFFIVLSFRFKLIRF